MEKIITLLEERHGLRCQMNTRRGRKDWNDHKDAEDKDKENEADKEVMWKEGPQSDPASDSKETKWPTERAFVSLF